MIDSGDARIPVVVGDPARAGAADVVQPMPPGAWRHPIGCACCLPRAPLAEVLSKLFFARARGDVPFFSRVVVPGEPGGEASLAAILAADPVTAARFRFAGRLG